tara:strand:- start:3 stop:863 length:861 start_codon:yes stop_codon:yes gene_type:complete
MNFFFNNQSKPVLLIIASCFLFSILAALIKYLNSFLHPFEQAFFRNVFSIIIILPIFFLLKENPYATNKKKVLFLRSFFGALTMILLFWSYTLIPLSQVMAISFSTPLFIFLGGIIFFKEKIDRSNILIMLCGFAFTILIIRPDISIKFGTIIALMAAISHAVTGLIVKNLTKTESVFCIMFYMVIFMSPLTFVPSFFVWEVPSEMKVWITLFLLALVGTLGNFCWTKAISLAPTTRIMPFEFSKLIFATIIGIMFFNENLDIITIFGGLGIIICNLIISKRINGK